MEQSWSACPQAHQRHRHVSDHQDKKPARAAEALNVLPEALTVGLDHVLPSLPASAALQCSPRRVQKEMKDISSAREAAPTPAQLPFSLPASPQTR